MKNHFLLFATLLFPVTVSAQVVINEFLYDPGSDVNQDGTTSATQDEFVELVNSGSSPVDLSGYRLTDSGGNFFEFPEESMIAGGGVVLVFGGGSPAATLNGATVFTGLPGLNNSGDSITLSDDSGAEVDEVEYSNNAATDESLNRSPELTGDFVPHSSVPGAVGSESPGTDVSGTNFGPPVPALGLSVDFSSVSENGGQATITVDSSENPDAGDYTFNIAVSDSSELSAPATFLVTGASDTGTFQVNGIDDFESDGPKFVTVTLTEVNGSFSPATITITVTDDEVFVFPTVLLNEIRIDENSTDRNEFFELFTPDQDVSLDRISLIVIGDNGSGASAVEAVVDLSGQSITRNYFFVGESSYVGGTPDFVTSLNFENEDNVTFLLVGDFIGTLGVALDPNNDGVLDSQPWSIILDGVGLVKEANPPTSTEYEYATSLGFPVVGPFVGDGLFFPPPHTFLDGEGNWQVGIVALTEDTPGLVNPDGDPPIVGDLEVTGITIDADDGRGTLTVKGLGAKSWILQSSTDLGSTDGWEAVAGGFTRNDRGDGSSTLSFFDTFSGVPRKFYRLIEDPEG